MSSRMLGVATAAVALAFSINTGAVAAEVKMSGSATVAGSVIKPNQAALEKETGLSLNIVVNGDGNGLKDLYAGKVDVAMVAAPIKATEETLNKIAPGTISTSGFQVTQVGTDALKFIVNPANPVKALSPQQLKDIFTGKITSWKDVGGPDQPILVVSVAPGMGQRVNLVTMFLEGAELSDKARSMQALGQVAQVVAQAPNAIGYGTAATITSAVAVIPGAEVKQALGLVTKGAPSDDVKKLIVAAAKLNK
jgi:phosphate transport system substrate-binding protein